MLNFIRERRTDWQRALAKLPSKGSLLGGASSSAAPVVPSLPHQAAESAAQVAESAVHAAKSDTFAPPSLPEAAAASAPTTAEELWSLGSRAVFASVATDAEQDKPPQTQALRISSNGGAKSSGDRGRQHSRIGTDSWATRV